MINKYAKKLEDEELSKYMQPDCELWENDLHLHFETFDFIDWIDVSDEALRVYNVALDCEAETDSPIDDVLSVTAASGWNAAMNVVSRALGIKQNDLEMAVHEWSDDKSKPKGNIEDFIASLGGTDE